MLAAWPRVSSVLNSPIHPSTHPSIHPPTHPLSTHSSIQLPVFPSSHPLVQSIHLPIHLSITCSLNYLSTHLSICLSSHPLIQPAFHLSTIFSPNIHPFSYLLTVSIHPASQLTNYSSFIHSFHFHISLLLFLFPSLFLSYQLPAFPPVHPLVQFILHHHSFGYLSTHLFICHLSV